MWPEIIDVSPNAVYLPRGRRAHLEEEATIGGQHSITASATTWMAMNGRKPAKIAVSVMFSGATDFR